MSAGMGILFSLFASLVLAWPSGRARRLTDFGTARTGTVVAALAGWVFSGLLLILPPLAAAYLLMRFYPEGLMIWRWVGLGALFWLATSGKLTPSVPFRPSAANDNSPVRGLYRTMRSMVIKGYSFRLALVVAAPLPQFFDEGRAAEPQILFAALLFSGLLLLAAAYYALFPHHANAFLNVIPERRKALKTGLNAYRQHGQTRISYRRKAA